jgi:hypothetical protein
MPEVMTPSHLACTVTVAIRSPDMSQESRRLGVRPKSGVMKPGHLVGLLPVCVGSDDIRRKSRPSKVMTYVGTNDMSKVMTYAELSTLTGFTLTSDLA